MANLYAPERQQYGAAIASMSGAATQIANTTTETILVPDYIFPANHFYAGRTVRGVITGVCSNVVTTPGTLTYNLRLGPATLSATAVSSSAALGLDTTARTSYGFRLSFEVFCDTSGASGTAFISGRVDQVNVLSSTAGNLLPNLIPTNANVAQALDTTVANYLSIGAKFSVNTSGTNITAQTYILESVI